jgi:hypothetical protein
MWGKRINRKEGEENEFLIRKPRPETLTLKEPKQSEDG